MMLSAAVLVVVGACAGSSGHTSARPVTSTSTAVGVVGPTPTKELAQHGVVTKVYAVGTAVAPGVYTAKVGGECSAIEVNKPDFDIFDDGGYDGPFVSSAPVEGVKRIALTRGMFFYVTCGTWALESASHRTPDPAVLSGACELLVTRDALVKQVIRALEADPARDSASPQGALVQDQLMAIVEARTPKVWALAGNLVDQLDAPRAFVGPDGKVDDTVVRTATRVDQLCSPH